MLVTLNCTFVEPVTIKRPRKKNLLCEGRRKSCRVILKADDAYFLKTTMLTRCYYIYRMCYIFLKYNLTF